MVSFRSGSAIMGCRFPAARTARRWAMSMCGSSTGGVWKTRQSAVIGSSSSVRGTSQFAWATHCTARYVASRGSASACAGPSGRPSSYCSTMTDELMPPNPKALISALRGRFPGSGHGSGASCSCRSSGCFAISGWGVVTPWVGRYRSCLNDSNTDSRFDVPAVGKPWPMRFLIDPMDTGPLRRSDSMPMIAVNSELSPAGVPVAWVSM